MMAIFDYDVLRVIWWFLLGFLLIGFAVMDGHDMGIGTLLPFLGKNDEERRIIINSVAAHWEGNQVWFITGGGAIFAALPSVYATAFSGFYWAMMAILWALFFRPVGFKYRSLLHNPRWRGAWDWGIFIGSFVPPIIFGVAFGNLFLGVPFHFDADLDVFYTGSFWALLNPFALLCGLLALSMLLMQGAVYLRFRTVAPIYDRCQKVIVISAFITALLFAVGGVWLYFLEGYVVVSPFVEGAPSNPLFKEVALEKGAWLLNYERFAYLWLLPALAFIMLLLSCILSAKGRMFAAFCASSLVIFAIIATAGASLFPFLMPSSSDLVSSLTIWDSTASRFSLTVMLFAVVFLMPIVLTYTTWAFRVMRGKVTKEYIKENEHSAY